VKGSTAFAPSFGVFEIGHVVNGLKADGLCDEHKKLCVTLFSRTEDTQALYFRLRDMLCDMAETIKHKPLAFRAAKAAHSWEHPKNLNTLLLDGRELGTLGVAHPNVAEKIDKKAAIVFAEMDIEAFVKSERAAVDYRVPSKYPGMEQDLTVYSDTFAPIAEAVAEVNSPLVQKVTVVSTFADAFGRTLSVRLFFSHPDRTLTGEEVQQVMDSVTAALEKKGIRRKM
jgi:phenylalanyl-tRNA synthetase beta chain